MSLTKRKISVSLDEDLVSELEAGSQSLSAQVNAAVRTDLDHRRRQRLLGALLDEMDEQYGPVDEALIQRYTEILA